MREMSVTEQRYKAVLGVIADGRTVGEVASGCSVPAVEDLSLVAHVCVPIVDGAFAPGPP